MKKILITIFICMITSAVPSLAQDVQNKLNRYVNSQLTQDEQSTVTNLPEEELQTDITTDEIRNILTEMINSGDCNLPDIANDLNEYITETAAFSATGELNQWEKKRSELYLYIQSSNWRTGKNISDADRAFAQTLKTIAFGLVKEVAQLCGWDRIIDRLEQEAINKYENNESIQNAIAMVEANISDATYNDDHTINVLYTKVQHNAFTLLSMNYVDYKKLSKAYPEVEFLFEDLYTFFKWRYELRSSDASYKLNENNINIEFGRASVTNSFFAFWELANIAKSEMRNAVENKNDNLITLTVSDERDNMPLFNAYAKQALYFGRLWNGMQHYAVTKELLPKSLDPKRGTGKNIIREEINKSLSSMKDDEILTMLDNIRTNYTLARQISEGYWNKWASVNLTERKRLQIKKQLQEILEQITDEKIEDTINNILPIDTLQNNFTTDSIPSF